MLGVSKRKVSKLIQFARGNMGTFLDQTEMFALTGRKMKSLQIISLRKMGIPYFVNATGHPVVTRSAIENKRELPQQQKWMPNVLRNN